MATLTGNSVGSSYLGLLKTTDNAAIDGNLKNMTDGAGNATPLSMSNAYVQLQAPTIELIESTGGTNLITIDSTQTLFEGAVDFTNATVTGIGGGSPGLELGSGSATAEGAPLSMQSGSAVTTISAQARGGGDVAIGDNANTKVAGTTFPSSSIAIGQNASTTAEKSIAIGRDSTVSAERGLAVGWICNAAGAKSIALGSDANATSGGNIAIGSNARALGATDFDRNAVAIGTSSIANEEQNVAVGFNARATGNRGLSIGTDALSVSSRAAAVGFSSQANNFAAVCLGDGNANGESSVSIGGFNTLASPAYSVAIGRETQVPSNIAKGMAMGYQVTAIWANALTIPQIAFTEVANLNYADQAAAVTGGVPVGGVYHTDGTLKIVY